MSYLPRITRLDISGYELYPGHATAEGLHRDLGPGITLVVGANGLGKTTLITLLRDMCAGPNRLSNRSGGTFGAGRLVTTRIEVETFADRVSDRAREASARIVMEIAGSTFDVTRSLRDLALTSLVVDGEDLGSSEGEFERLVVEAAEVPDYAHWLLLIDYLVFVTEDRAEPFWDRNIQRYLLRVLTRDAAGAAMLAEAESRHVSADSDFRNARVQLNRHRQRFEKEAAKVEGTGEVNDELRRCLARKESLDPEIAELEQRLEQARDRDRDAIREEEVAAVDLQVVRDALEVARFALIEAAMPSQDDVARYLSVRLATSDACPWCGREGGHVAERLSGDSCFFCGLPQTADHPEAEAAALSELESRAGQAETAVKANAARAQERREDLRQIEASLAALKSERADLERDIRALRAQLPEGSTDLGSTAALIKDLEADLELLRIELEASRAHLQGLIAAGNEAVRARQDDIKRVFDRVATTFLVEQCELVPHETAVRIGQEGERFEVQAFNLDLGSSTELGASRRDSGDQVSESQRVFVDVAFRIALVDACVSSGAGTLVVDAPEGSLDAVFSANAAALLFEFVASRTDRYLIVASNLIEGSMLPRLAELAGVTSDSDPRLVNLLEVAAPTAAVLARGDEYRDVLRRAVTSNLSDGA